MKPRFIFFLLLLTGILGVITIYHTMSGTDDELFHISCGMEWWKYGTYTTEALHPPLARIADATLPYLLHSDDASARGASGESPSDTYIYTLTSARIGVLPFYIFSCLLVFAWSRKLYGEKAALWSLGSYVTLATVTTNGALATTDMVYACMLVWALFSATQWIESPTSRNSVALGISVGLAIASKFSTFVQFPSAMILILLYRRKLPTLNHVKYGALWVAPIVCFVVAAIYHFSLAPFWQGIADANDLNHEGFGVWLYGPLHHNGLFQSLWYFFPVVFFFKTPLPFFASATIGNRHVNGEKLYPLLAAIGIMAVSMTSNINLGVRHVLPLYLLLAVPAGYGFSKLWEGGPWKRDAALALMLWQVAGFINSYPEPIAYFNELAGEHPEHITLDSDYDWGQNIFLLRDTIAQNHIDQIYLCSRKDSVWSAHILVKAEILPCPQLPVTGWIAVTRAKRMLHPNNFTWLTDYQAVQRIGKTMDLYHIQ